jgi:DNA recombination protein RmuC
LTALLRESEGSLQRTREENRQISIQMQEQKQSLEQVGKKFESEFQVLAQRILDEKTKVFQQSQESSLGQMLNPLRDQLRNFKEEFESRYKTESNERISLREQIRHMLDLNQTLSTQAENLTRALTNNVKSQGDWGESILESILQYAGLQRDLHYFVQESSQNEAGETIRPDVIIKYPDGRALVVDSKVSLLHYTRFIAAADDAERKQQEALLLQSFRQHADGLSRKNYQSVADALDFVLMFVPVESAYIQAMQADTTLWQFAYQKRVLLISPTNLVPAMKLVADLWQRDGISRHATAIAERAGKLYDKLVGFVDNFEKVGSQLEKASDTWRDAQKQLVQGRGNLISQAEKMREMHIKTQKKLPGNWTEQAEDEEEDNL